jgi:hypothetical protein
MATTSRKTGSNDFRKDRSQAVFEGLLICRQVYVACLEDASYSFHMRPVYPECWFSLYGSMKKSA